MHAEQRRVEAELRGEVPVAHRVHGVLRGPVEAQLGRDRLGVERERRAGQRARAQRGHRGPLVPVPQPAHVPGEGLGVGEQLMGEHDRLGVLQVRHPRGRRAGVLPGLGEQGRLQLSQPRDHPPDVVAQVHAQVGGDLIVPAPAGPQLAAERADPFEQAPFEGGVHVLVRDRRPEPALPARLVEVIQRGQQAAGLLVVQQPGPVQDPGVGPRGEQVIRGQPPVELDADRQPGQRLGGAGPEPPSPQPRRCAFRWCLLLRRLLVGGHHGPFLRAGHGPVSLSAVLIPQARMLREEERRPQPERASPAGWANSSAPRCGAGPRPPRRRRPDRGR